MIEKQEIFKAANEKQLDPVVIERDYALGWALWGISQNTELSKLLAFKGGTSLKKCYFPDYRFSEDLDFTVVPGTKISEQKITENLKLLCESITAKSNIQFLTEKTTVKTTRTAANEEAYRGAIYFIGPRGDSRNPLRIKFDITDYEIISRKLLKKEIIHHYSDADECACEILTYSLEEIIAEKMRALLQRTRPRDYYDVWYILKNKQKSINSKEVLEIFNDKAQYKNVHFEDIMELIGDEKFNNLLPAWETQLDHQLPYSPDPRKIRPEFNTLIKTLFTENRPSFKEEFSPPEQASAPSKLASIREKIINAGKQRRIISIEYNGEKRLVEPYSFRYKYGKEYFYGYNLIGGNSPPSIRSFILPKIQTAEITKKSYVPRWPIEF